MKRFFTLLCAVVAFAACEQVFVDVANDVAESDRSLSVSFEGDETRVQLNEAQKTVWTKGDQASVFYFSDANQLWQYDGETGSRTANLKRVNACEPTEQTTYNVVAYPFNEDYFLNTRTGALHATLPATQHYLKDSYGVGDNLMVAQSEFTQFSLKNVCGWLKLQFTGDGEVVKSITFKGNDGEQVAGLIHVDTATAEATLASEMGSADDNNAGGNLVFDDTILTEVALDCGEGVALGKEATAFYIALPPQTFEQGVAVEILCDGYKPMTLATTSEVVIERNHIKPMAAVEFEAEEGEGSEIPNKEIWYTATAKVEAPSDHPWTLDTFGAKVVSNEWDSESGKGVITFDADVTTIGYAAFYYCDSLTSITIPDSVTTIGDFTFYCCKNLTSVTIPDSVKIIGDNAFTGCSSLKEFKGKFAADGGRCLVVYGVLEAFAIGCGVTQYTIPNRITTIYNSAFSGCSSLTSVTIPNSVTSIGDYAFNGCSNLTNVTIGKGVSNIGTYAFKCSGFSELTLPGTITSIGNGTFYSTSLSNVSIAFSANNLFF